MPASLTPTITLETDRLVLRPHVRDDFADNYAMWSDPDVTRFIGGKPSTREECWARLLRYIGHWTMLGFGYWAVREKATGRFVGDVGFANFQREIDPPIGDLPEIGWALARDAHGNGYATEAVQAALRWADAQWPGRDTVCIVAPENVASLRVAAKCGYIERERGSYKNQPTIVLRRNADAR